jgi:putative ABC transport system substrate-binding protein
MIIDPKNPGMMLRLAAIRAAAVKLAINLQSIPALSADELRSSLTGAASDPPDAVIVLSPIYAAYRDEVVSFAAKARVPLSFDTRALAREPGALLSYGVDISVLFRRSATFVDKILKGANPADLPVEQPTKFEFVINTRTARALGIAVPGTLLARADEVIE